MEAAVVTGAGHVGNVTVTAQHSVDDLIKYEENSVWRFNTWVILAKSTSSIATVLMKIPVFLHHFYLTHLLKTKFLA